MKPDVGSDASTGGGADAATALDASSDSGGASAACDDKAAQPLDQTWSLTVGTLTRTARVHVPASSSSG